MNTNIQVAKSFGKKTPKKPKNITRGEWEHRPQGDYDMLNWDLHYGPLTSVNQRAACLN